MKKDIRKFLEFNGKLIHFLSVDGEYWIALKPICDALGVQWNSQHVKLQNGDDIYGELSRDHEMVAADKKLRKMVSLPERFVYGWIFSIPFNNTMSDETKQNLKAYKLECCDILYEHFHGSITGRKELLSEKARIQLEIDRCFNTLDPTVALRLDKANSQLNKIKAQLRVLDQEVVDEEKTLFDT